MIGLNNVRMYQCVRKGSHLCVSDMYCSFYLFLIFSVYKLRKVFKQGKKNPDVKALDGVSFDVFEGQITALLGHNGAGKSTLISTLTGMLSPTKGSAELYGFNITKSEDMDNIRQIIGNVLFSNKIRQIISG